MTLDPGTQGCTGLGDGAAMPDNSRCMSLPPHPRQDCKLLQHSNLPQILPPPIHPSTIHPSIHHSSIHQSIIQASSTRCPPLTHPFIHSFIHPVSTIQPFIHPSTVHSFSHPSIPNLPQSLHCQAYCASFPPTLFIINCNLPKAGDPAQPKAKNLTCNSRASH